MGAANPQVKRLRPASLIIIGLLLLFGGFAYDVLFAGIPYQDAPPEKLDRYVLHRRISSVICLLGFFGFVVGSGWGVTRLLTRRS